MLALLLSPVLVVSGTPAVKVDDMGYRHDAASENAMKVDSRCADSVRCLGDSLNVHLTQVWVVLDSLQNHSAENQK